MKEKRIVEDWQKIHSAKYILEDLNHEKGMEALAELAGLPMGVIVSAFQNIFSEDIINGGTYKRSRYRVALEIEVKHPNIFDGNSIDGIAYAIKHVEKRLDVKAFLRCDPWENENQQAQSTKE